MRYISRQVAARRRLFLEEARWNAPGATMLDLFANLRATQTREWREQTQLFVERTGDGTKIHHIAFVRNFSVAQFFIFSECSLLQRFQKTYGLLKYFDKKCHI